MSQDTVADALNQMMNIRRAGKEVVEVKKHSKLLLSILAIAKLKGYVENYKADGTKLNINLGKLNGCNAIKPRFIIKVGDIDKYIKRYLPSKNLGILIISTSQGLMTHLTASDKNLGGSLIAYFY
ncbi:MAG: 30S ribosomal protein S8 [Nanoarchaeota archaeon]|nr:30S ribosomal protein S8 [Nanoarchaeota archaeon]MBU1051638.1 30S ribosomal protein S8 [Nanoarchaeota archaeon]MBU1988840.1 30S ribosomal protein S8 [Nanoarchaeota archaeon]